MKTTSRLMNLHRLTVAIAASIALLFTASAHADSSLLLDFNNSGGPVTSGYTAVSANFLANTPTASAAVGSLTFTIDNVGSYNAGNAGEPLTTSGFYTFGNDANDHNFSLTGLTAGSTVSLYAVAAWDGNGRGAQLSFDGGSYVQAQTIGDPGTSPTLANYTLIGTGIVGVSGELDGIMTGAGGPLTGTEGQLGAFVFDIETPATPEPSTYMLLGCGLALLAVLVRRRQVNATL